MSTAVIIHGAIGSGKTKTCVWLVEKARAMGIPTGGILGLRRFRDGELKGYDCQDLGSGRIFPLVRLRDEVAGPDWFQFRRLKYAFSNRGFERANEILAHSAASMSSFTLVIVDEYGRLEEAGLGLHQGALRVSEALSGGGAAVFTCRDNLVRKVRGFVQGRAGEVHESQPGELDSLWDIIRRALGPV
jgi:nucleoside-triphosphatase THEP1